MVFRSTSFSMHNILNILDISTPKHFFSNSLQAVISTRNHFHNNTIMATSSPQHKNSYQEIISSILPLWPHHHISTRTPIKKPLPQYYHYGHIITLAQDLLSRNHYHNITIMATYCSLFGKLYVIYGQEQTKRFLKKIYFHLLTYLVIP